MKEKHQSLRTIRSSKNQKRNRRNLDSAFETFIYGCDNAMLERHG
jgi:hypothetical protein